MMIDSCRRHGRQERVVVSVDLCFGISSCFWTESRPVPPIEESQHVPVRGGSSGKPGARVCGRDLQLRGGSGGV